MIINFCVIKMCLKIRDIIEVTIKMYFLVDQCRYKIDVCIKYLKKCISNKNCFNCQKIKYTNIKMLNYKTAIYCLEIFQYNTERIQIIKNS
jgi:hypothetical protein